MSNPTSNFGWQMPTATDLVTDLPADFEVFGQAVDSSMADLKGGTTGQILAKATNTDMDFTWIANDQGDITAVSAGTGISVASGTGPIPVVTNSMATEITAAGDIIIGTGSGTFDNLPIGTTGQLLTADTTVSPYKVKWATPAASASGLTYITKQTASDVASLTFDSVFDTTYTNYLLVYDGVRSTTGSLSADLYFQYRYAGPTTQAATYQYGIYGTSTSSAVITIGATNQNQMILSRNLGNSSSRVCGFMHIEGVGAGSGEFPLAQGQTSESWGEEFLSYGFNQYTARTYTGFIITTSAGNINGTFTLYGLAKS
jgi:hypothetical protein